MDNSNPHVVNVYIHDKEDGLPDPKDIASKYDIDYKDVYSDDDSLDDTQRDTDTHRGDSQEIIDHQMHNNRVDELVLKLDAKNREIERLCVLLEAVSVVPGADPGKYIDIIDNKGDDTLVDYRDTKIVTLAKKCRNLTVALNKERAASRNAKDKLITLQDEVERLKRELELVSSPAARAAARGEGKSGGDPDVRDLRRELNQANKQMEELRRKAQQSQDEARKLSRALAKELGEGVSIDQAVDEGWRGRAQQIVMLKSKIKRLESGRISGAASQRSRHNDVDAKAEEELSSMSAERQQAVEALTEDHQRLTEECAQLNSKLDRQKVCKVAFTHCYLKVSRSRLACVHLKAMRQLTNNSLRSWWRKRRVMTH